MKKTGAELARFALEQIGVTHTFGIPGVHNTELYDQLAMSDQITPVQVTHEAGAAFMADATSRVSDRIGTLVVVPAAGLTHAASGIGEAFLDGIAMLVICGGVRNDLDFQYQLHQMDQHQFMKGLTKSTYLVETHEDVIKTLYDAFEMAVSGEPGPVFVEIPVNIQLLTGDVTEMPVFKPAKREPSPITAEVFQQAAESIRRAKRPGIFAGWGAKDAADDLMKLAEIIDAPVATTLQGLSVFPSAHPLHVGMGFGPSAVPAAQNAFENCDCMIAIGTRFSEIPTGSFGVTVPENLIHIDINPNAINANYPAKVAMCGDARDILPALVAALGNDGGQENRDGQSVRVRIAADKKAYHDEWLAHDSKDRVNPQILFDGMNASFSDETIIVLDDGNHTFLAAELLPINKVKGFICPSDFNCMGYATPAAIGAKLAAPGSDVIAIVGDGAFTMTCMEILTASRLGLGVAFFVFNDGELSQIAQAQTLPYNRKTCTVMGELDVASVAAATGAEYLEITQDEQAADVTHQALEITRQDRPVIVNVAIDYSKKTAFTKGTVQTNFKRFPVGTKMRFLGRALSRKITG